MDVNSTVKKMLDFIKKYKYAVVVLIIGICLMGIPQKKEGTEVQILPEKEDTSDISVRLEQILSGIQGAGKVKVFVTVSEGEQVLYQTDTDIALQGESKTERSTTILITDAERNESGLEKQRIGPKYQGAIIVCQGADQSSIKLAITDAVSKVTGLKTDKICVLKMK